MNRQELELWVFIEQKDALGAQVVESANEARRIVIPTYLNVGRVRYATSETVQFQTNASRMGLDSFPAFAIIDNTTGNNVAIAAFTGNRSPETMAFIWRSAIEGLYNSIELEINPSPNVNPAPFDFGNKPGLESNGSMVGTGDVDSFGINPFGIIPGSIPPFLILALAVASGYKASKSRKKNTKLAFGAASGFLFLQYLRPRS